MHNETSDLVGRRCSPEPLNLNFEESARWRLLKDLHNTNSAARGCFCKKHELDLLSAPDGAEFPLRELPSTSRSQRSTNSTTQDAPGLYHQPGLGS